MFLNTGNLNEGGCRDKCIKGIKRELYEGKNPKATNANWHSNKSPSYVNEHWQQLRK